MSAYRAVLESMQTGRKWDECSFDTLTEAAVWARVTLDKATLHDAETKRCSLCAVDYGHAGRCNGKDESLAA